MDNQKINDLKTKVEGRLLQKIQDLEAVRNELEEETRDSDGDEKTKNQQLLDATTNLLNELKQAQHNIHELIERNG